MHASRPLRSGHQPKRPLIASGRHSLLTGSYLLYLALVLPFICWGALANPGHPHAGAHFVFATPPGVHERQVYLATLENDICGNPALSGRIPLPAFGNNAGEDGPAGQSLPATMMALLILAFFGTVAYWVRWMRQRVRLLAICAEARFQPNVPTPPPRTS
jgi:hypothetical protein